MRQPSGRPPNIAEAVGENPSTERFSGKRPLANDTSEVGCGRRVSVWDVQTGAVVSSRVMRSDVLSLAANSAPCDLAAVGIRGELALLALPDLSDVAGLEHNGHVRSVAFSPDGSCIVGGGGGNDHGHGLMSGKQDAAMTIWRTSDEGRCCQVARTVLFDNIVQVTRFAPSGESLAVGGEDCKVTVLAVSRDFEKACELVCAAGVRALAWTSQSRFLAVGGEEMQVCIWDVIKEIVVLQFQKRADWISSLCFGPGDLWLASCAFSSTDVSLHAVECLTVDSPAPRPDAGSSSKSRDSLAPIAIAESDLGDEACGPRLSLSSPRNSQILKSAGTVNKLDEDTSHTPSPACVMSLPGLEERTDLAGGMTGFQLSVTRVQDKDKGGTDFVSRMRAATSSADDASLGAALGMDLAPLSIRLSRSAEAVELPHTDEVMGVAFGPGAWCVAGGEDASVVLWDVASRSRRCEAQMEAAVVAVAVSPSGEFYVAADAESVVSVWSRAGDYLGSTSVKGEAKSLSMSSAPRELLAVGTNAKSVVLLSVPDLEEVAVLEHGGDVLSVSFSPDGRLLAAGGGTDDMHGLMTKKAMSGHQMKTVVWRVPADGECGRLGDIAFEDIVHAVAFSPGGKMLAVAGENRMIATLLVDHDFQKASELHSVAGVRCLGFHSRVTHGLTRNGPHSVAGEGFCSLDPKPHLRTRAAEIPPRPQSEPGPGNPNGAVEAQQGRVDSEL